MSTINVTDFHQPQSFLDESEALFDVLAGVDASLFTRPTRFKEWAINDILAHLHIWNWALEQAIVVVPAFDNLLLQFKAHVKVAPVRTFENTWVAPLHGPELLDAWWAQCRQTTALVQSVDPKLRTRWFGPDMSARSNITARLMETWAHGQAIHDLLGLERVQTDRLKDIAVLGIHTFDWTFRVRKLQPPSVHPHVRLRAPSGATWSWNEASDTDLIEGNAAEFCQVVTQVRHVDDTQLHVVGEAARLWMASAQCFAGPAHTPPAAGTRFREPTFPAYIST